MSFDPTEFLAVMLVSSIGVVLFVYGKRQQRWPQLAIGIVLSVYPYFITNVWAVLLIAALLLLGLYVAVRAGL